MVDAGFVRCKSEMCFYWKRDGADLVVVGVYVDDLLATGKSAAAVDRFFHSLTSLSMKDFGQVSKFLGMRVQRDGEGGYKIDQEEAIDNLVRDNILADANPTRMPIGDDCYEVKAGNTELLGTTGAKPGPTVRDFQFLVGSLLWIARCARPDIVFAVHKVTRKTHTPRVYDWKFSKRAARYLKGPAALKTTMTTERDGNVTKRLEASSDADYAAENPTGSR